MTSTAVKLTDGQIHRAQVLLRSWGCGPTTNRMIVELAGLIQFAQSSVVGGDETDTFDIAAFIRINDELKQQIGQLTCSVSDEEMINNCCGISVHQRKQQFNRILRARLVASCPHQMETHCDTDGNGAGGHREYW